MGNLIMGNCCSFENSSLFRSKYHNFAKKNVKVDIVHIGEYNYLNKSSAEFFIEKIPFGTDINEEGQLIAFLKKEFKDWHVRLYDSKGDEQIPLKYNVPFENIEILQCKAHVKKGYLSEQDMGITSPFFKFIQDPEKDLKIVSYRLEVRITKKSNYKKTRTKK